MRLHSAQSQWEVGAYGVNLYNPDTAPATVNPGCVALDESDTSLNTGA